MNQQKEQFEKIIAEFVETISIALPGCSVSIDVLNIEPHEIKAIEPDCNTNYVVDSKTGVVTYRLSKFKWLDAEMNHALHIHSKRLTPTPVNQ